MALAEWCRGGVLHEKVRPDRAIDEDHWAAEYQALGRSMQIFASDSHVKEQEVK